MNLGKVVKAVVPVAAVVLTAVSSLMSKHDQKEMIAKEVAKALLEKEK